MRKLINYIMEGMEAIWGGLKIIFFMWYFRLLAFFGYLAKSAALFSARVFSCGNSPLFLEDLV